MSATKLFDLATQLLDVCESILTANSLEVPANLYVCGNALPTGACDQLVVGWARVAHGTPTGTQQPFPVKGAMSPRQTSLTIWLFRCISDTLQGQGEQLAYGTPNPEAATADAQVIMSDAYCLHKGLVIAHAASELGNDYGTPIIVEDFIPLTASGGVGGCRGGITYELS